MGLRSIVLAVVFASLTSHAQISFRFNWTPRTALADCANVGSNINGSRLNVTVNGVQQIVTTDPTTNAAFLSTFNAVNGDVVTAFLTLPSGRVRTFDDVAGDPSRLSLATTADLLTYINDLSVDPNEDVCSDGRDVDYAGGGHVVYTENNRPDRGFFAASVPAAVEVTMLDGDGLKNLGSRMKWDSTPGALWDVYHYEDVGVYGPCPAITPPDKVWTQINSAPIHDNPAGNVFSEFPVPQPQFNFNLPYMGAGGVWCYAVAQVVNGVDGPMTVATERNLLGQYFYGRVCIQSPPYVKCDSHTGGQSLFQQVTWTINRNGVQMPIKTHHDTAAGYQYTSVFRALGGDVVDGGFSLDTLDGKFVPVHQLIGPPKNPDRARDYVTFLNVTTDKATESIVHTTYFKRYRIASAGN